MANNLTDAAENAILDHICGTATYTLATPIQVALLTSNGSDSAAGTEVTGGSYAREDVTFSSASGGATSNSGTLQWTGMPACTVTGINIYDSTGTPKRIWHIPLTSSKTVNAGDTFEILSGDIDLSLD